MRLPKFTVAVAAVGAFAQVTRRMNAWGATPAEMRRTYPGDELVGDPAGTANLAVTIAAPPQRIWPWLVQIGRDRGGMYSYDWLENAFGLDIHSSTEIRPEWQHLVPGQRIELAPPGWAPGMPDGYGFRVAQAEPPHTLVLRQAPPEHPWDGVWTFVIDPISAESSRLISHSRTRRSPGLAGRALVAATSLGIPITWLMTRKMLLTIKARAEDSVRSEG